MHAFPRSRHTGHVEKSSSERRLEPRILVTESVQVTLLDDSEDAFSGKTLDISESGLSLTSPLDLPLRTPLKVEVGDAMVLGEVRHCRLIHTDPAEYATGVAIDSVVFGWQQFYERVRAS